MLVMLTDQRRNRQRVNAIDQEITNTKLHAESKRETIWNQWHGLKTTTKASPGAILRFNIEMVRQLTVESVDQLTPERRRVIDSIRTYSHALLKLESSSTRGSGRSLTGVSMTTSQRARPRYARCAMTTFRGGRSALIPASCCLTV
jgi:hypothetical protein